MPTEVTLRTQPLNITLLLLVFLFVLFVNTHRAVAMKAHHNKAGRHVTMWSKEKRTWHTAIVQQKCKEPRSYIIQTPNGHMLRRSRSHLRGPLNTDTQQRTVSRTHLAIPQMLGEHQEGHGEQRETAPSCEPKTQPPSHNNSPSQSILDSEGLWSSQRLHTLENIRYFIRSISFVFIFGN